MISAEALEAHLKKYVRRLYKKMRCTRCNVVCVADACWYCWSPAHLEEYRSAAALAPGPRFEEAA